MPELLSSLDLDRLRLLLLAEDLSPRRARRLLRRLKQLDTQDTTASPGTGGAAPTADGRYVDLGKAPRQGAMGELRRVHDTRLGRELLMKILPRGAVDDPERRRMFEEEIRITSMLQHPGIVPVHDAGVDAGGRPWFVMRYLDGPTLGDLVEVAHHGGPDAPDPSAVSPQRLIQALAAACRSVAYAHRRGVVHRDLKSSNLVVGELGGVTVLDWGVACELGGPDWSRRLAVGTPGFRAPEQVEDPSRVDPRSDVFALGQILRHVLLGTEPTGAPGPVATDGLRIGRVEELAGIAARAIAPEPSRRYPDASALAAALQDFVDGIGREADARVLVERARVELDAAVTERRLAATELEEARQLLDALEPTASDDERAEGWRFEDAASEHELGAALRENRAEQELHAALRLVEGLADAHVALFELHRRQHVAAEARGDRRTSRVLEERLREHFRSIPRSHAARSDAEAYLADDGFVSIVTAPAGADVMAYRVVERHRRWVDGDAIGLGRTPLLERRIPTGRYVLVLRAEGHLPVRYPAVIGRLERWHGRGPDDDRPRPIALPPLTGPDALGPGEVYVPAGWCWIGGDDVAHQSLPLERAWVDGFVIDRHVVTCGRFLDFLNDLHRRGRREQADAHQPRLTHRAREDFGELLFSFVDGEYRLPAPRPAWTVEREHPVIFVTHDAASAFAAWEAERTGRPWRLVRSVEWEKAARGVDQRVYPMGDHLEPSWTWIADCHGGRDAAPQPITRPTLDVSPYGVRYLAGNVMEWLGDRFTLERPLSSPPPGPASDDVHFEVRGGSWSLGVRDARAAARMGGRPSARGPDLGFRLARSWPPSPPSPGAPP